MYVELRGYKTVSDVPTTYVLRVYRGPQSILALAVASHSALFPTKEIGEFWRSIEGFIPVEDKALAPAEEWPGEIVQSARTNNLTKHVDRTNSFAVTHDASFSFMEPNEGVTKLLLSPKDGQRCWVIVVPNPLIESQEDVDDVLRFLLERPDLLRAEYEKLYKKVSEVSVSPVVVSGNRRAALASYEATYEAVGVELVISASEAHLLLSQKAYKIGCSTADVRDAEFEATVVNFLRGFQILPPA
jgi:hypothetical protein